MGNYNMKLTNKKLKQLVFEVLSEATSTRTGLGGAKKKGYKSDKTTDFERKYREKTHQHKTHHGEQPDKTQTVTQSDLTKWTHPWSKQTTTLGKGETQPAKGWQYRQATTTPCKTDTSKWIHPYKVGDKGTELKKGQTQPKFGWAHDTQLKTGYTSPVEPSLKQKGEFRSYELNPRDINPAPTHGW